MSHQELNQTRARFRRLFPAALAAGTALIILLTLWTVGPKLWSSWRDQSIEKAIGSGGPAFWWPSSWRAEYELRSASRLLDLADLTLLPAQPWSGQQSPRSRLLDLADLTLLRPGNDILAVLEAPQEIKQESRLAVIGSAPDFKLTDQMGGEFRMSELKGNVVLVSFIFTTCSGSCPATTHRMNLVQRELKSRELFAGSRVRLLSITLDPLRDSPDVLRHYMQLYDASAEHWSFLTGARNEVEKTIEAWGMWVRPAANGQLDHPSRIFLVDAQGRIREIYNLSFMNPDWVADDIKLLLDETKR